MTTWTLIVLMMWSSEPAGITVPNIVSRQACEEAAAQSYGNRASAFMRAFCVETVAPRTTPEPPR